MDEKEDQSGEEERLPGFRIVRSSTEAERDIITAAITSTEFMARFIDDPFLGEKIFQIDYAREIFRFCKDHYSRYGASPGVKVKNLFEKKRAGIDPAIYKFANEFLMQLDAEYEFRKVTNVNVELEMARNYANRMKAWELARKIEALADADTVEKVSTELEKFKLSTPDIYQTVNLFDTKKVIELLFSEKAEEGSTVVKFPGKLGRLVGPFKRGWLVGFAGHPGVGKTWWMIESSYRALMSGSKVLFISLEMTTEEVLERMVRRMLHTTKAIEPGTLIKEPCFDCYKNMFGSCHRSERENDVPLYDKKRQWFRTFNFGMDYRVCTWCRTHWQEFDRAENPYEAGIFYREVTHEHKIFGADEYLAEVERAKKRFDGNIEIYSTDAYSLTVDGIRHLLNDLHHRKGFIPDVVVVDWADVIAQQKSSGRGAEFRHLLDYVWKSLKGLALNRNCLVLTASGLNRGSENFNVYHNKDLCEDYRKANNVDVMIGINKNGVGWRMSSNACRINIMKYRNYLGADPLDSNRHVLVLHDALRGHVNIDSEDEFLIADAFGGSPEPEDDSEYDVDFNGEPVPGNELPLRDPGGWKRKRRKMARKDAFKN